MNDDDTPVHWTRDRNHTAKAIRCDVCLRCQWRDPGSIDTHCSYGGPHGGYQTANGESLNMPLCET